jgi:hypothetical protein
MHTRRFTLGIIACSTCLRDNAWPKCGFTSVSCRLAAGDETAIHGRRYQRAGLKRRVRLAACWKFSIAGDAATEAERRE